MKRILIADHDLETVRKLTHMFEPLGYGIETAESCDEMLLKIDHEKFDVIILNLFLPRRGTLDLIPIIRNKCQDVPVLGVTQNDSLTLEREARGVGISYYFVKPVELERMKDMVVSLVK